jgi:hypothetical protein
MIGIDYLQCLDGFGHVMLMFSWERRSFENVEEEIVVMTVRASWCWQSLTNKLNVGDRLREQT